MKSLSFVIPCYNSEKTIGLVVEKIEKAVYGFKEKFDYEIVLVNDYSRDNTLKVCKDICSIKPFVKLISFSKNFGQHHALMAGLRETNGDYIVCLDDDLQTPPEEVEKLISTLEQGYDVVYGQYRSKKHSAFRNVGSKLNSMMANYLINKPKNIDMTSFFIVRRYIVDEVVKYDKPYPYLGGLIFRVTQNIGSVFVEHKDREVGVSNYNFKKLVSLWLNGFTNFSVKPLRLASLLGFISSIVALLYMQILVIRRFLNPNIPMGWTSVVVLIMFFGGVQLISVGLVGEYVGRIYLCMNKTPQYVVKESYNKSKLEE